MKAKHVEIGGLYRALVSGKFVNVRIDGCRAQYFDGRAWRSGGWTARNMLTGRIVVIKTAARLRSPLEARGSR